MNDTEKLMLAWLAGGMLGAMFFGGLWWTVRKCLSFEQPALLVLGSVLLRTSIVLAGFYFIAQGQWERLVACLCGFIIARMIMTRLTRAGQGGEPCVLLPIN